MTISLPIWRRKDTGGGGHAEGDLRRVSPAALHRRLALRLGLGGLAIAVVLGGGVLVTDASRIDQAVVALAKADAARLSPVVPDGLARLDSAGRAALRTRLAAGMTPWSADSARHLAMAAIYGLDRRRVALSVSPSARLAAGELDLPQRFSPDAGHTRYAAGQLYIQVTTALTRAGGGQVGWLEEVYHIPGPALSALVHRGLRASLLVIMAVLGTTGLLYPVIAGLNHGLVRRSAELLHANVGTLEALGGAIAKRDSDTNSHNFRVTLSALRLGQAVGLDTGQMRALIKGAFLHDVGKLAVPDAVLLKPGRLTEAEFAVMKKHVDHGLDIVRHVDWLADAAQVVGGHHEWFDGSGYPLGLAGEAIPLVARIFSVADVFDALTSRRPYKAAFTLERSLALLAEGRGTHFDPRLLDLFTALAPGLYAELADCEEQRLERRLRAAARPYFAETLLT